MAESRYQAGVDIRPPKRWRFLAIRGQFQNSSSVRVVPFVFADPPLEAG
jgi:hypothetical protein